MPITLTTAATTASQVTNNVVTNTSAVNNSATITNSLDAVTNLAQTGLSNLGTAVGTVAGQAQQALSGVANAISNQSNLGNIFLNAVNLASKVNIPETEGRPPFRNLLHRYASYNYIFTLSVLSDAALNFPEDNYKRGILGPIILRSGSGQPDNRIKTAYGKFDFYIDNVSINGIVGFEKSTGNTNAVGFKFKVIEPYSMGLFFQAIQVAAKESGHKNFIDIPMLLTVEFMGHLNSVVQGVNGDSLTKDERTTRHFPLKFSGINMKVNARGCEYEIEAYPYNDKALSTTYSQIKTDVSIEGQSVHELLQTGTKSLQRILNNKLEEDAKAQKKAVPDQILIFFPADPSTGQSTGSAPPVELSATVNPTDRRLASGTQTTPGGTSAAPGGATTLEARLGVALGQNKTLVQDVSGMNDMGKASMSFSIYRPGDPPFAKDNFAYDKETHSFVRGDVTIRPNTGEMKFAQGSNILNIINQVILVSDYGRNALRESQVSPTGKIPWWRIETHTYNIPTDANLPSTGTKPKLFVYRIVPYGVDASRFMPPNATNPTTSNAKKTAIKSYEYIYTSKNLDILDFNIEFNTGFYQALNADFGKNNQDIQRAKSLGQGAPEKQGIPTPPAIGSSDAAPGNFPTMRHADQIKSNTDLGGTGGGTETPATMAAKQFHAIATESADMIQTTLKILGDPFYLGDSGIGNYTAKSTQHEGMNADYAMQYERGEILINVNFRTPIDIDVSKGTYNFGPTGLVNEFSGLYRVLQCESQFNGGKFTQTLQLVRLPGQRPSSDSDNETINPTDRRLAAGTQQSPGGSGKIELSKPADDVTPEVYDNSLQNDLDQQWSMGPPQEGVAE